MKNKWLSAVFFGSLLAMGVSCVGAQDTVKHDMKNAGHSTKNAATDTGHAVKHGTKKTYHATKHGTKKVVHKSAQKTDEGARHVEGKTEPK
jgi:hypothetical protein